MDGEAVSFWGFLHLLPCSYVLKDVAGLKLLDSFSFDGLLGMDILRRQCALPIEPRHRCRLRFGGLG